MMSRDECGARAPRPGSTPLPLSPQCRRHTCSRARAAAGAHKIGTMHFAVLHATQTYGCITIMNI